MLTLKSMLAAEQPNCWPPEYVLPFVRWANIIHFPAGGGNPLHQLPDHQLIFVLEGQGNLIVQGSSRSIAPDQLYFISPRSWYEMRAASDQQLSILTVHFDWQTTADSKQVTFYYNVDEPGSQFRDALFIPGWGGEGAVPLDLRGKPELRFMLEQIVAAFRRTDEYAAWECGGLLVAFLGQIARIAHFLHETKERVSIGLQSAQSVENAYRVLEGSLEYVDFSALAHDMGWSPDHLRRMLRLVFGQTPGQIQTAGRIRRAKELLRYGDIPIAQIGLQCGFSDSSHFARVFKHEVGLTPRQFRTFSRQDFQF